MNAKKSTDPVKILYAGCGIGLHAIALAKDKSECNYVVGLDKSSSLIELAKRNRELESLKNIEFIQSDLVSYRPNKELFDVLILGNGELLPLNRESILTAAIDLLEEDGCIIGRDFVTDEANVKYFEDALYYVDPITAKDYSSLINKIGYSDVDIKEFDASNAPSFKHIPQIDSLFDSKQESTVIIVRK